MTHDFRMRLLRGDRLLGTMITLPSPEVTELMAAVGFDWLFLDGEHGVLAARDLQAMLQAAGAPVPCVVRIPGVAAAPIKQALDVGAAGIIAPLVNSAAEAEQVVRWAKYPPVGSRGVGVARAHGYGLHLSDYLASANDRVAVIVQAEHIDAVTQIEAIVGVAGIDAVLVGPYDLSASLGQPGAIDHPDVVAAVERITTVCRQAGMRLGIFGVSAEAVRPYLAKGYTLIVAGIDTLLLGQAAQGLLNQLKA